MTAQIADLMKAARNSTSTNTTGTITPAAAQAASTTQQAEKTTVSKPKLKFSHQPKAREQPQTPVAAQQMTRFWRGFVERWQVAAG